MAKLVGYVAGKPGALILALAALIVSSPSQASASVNQRDFGAVVSGDLNSSTDLTASATARRNVLTRKRIRVARYKLGWKLFDLFQAAGFEPLQTKQLRTRRINRNQAYVTQEHTLDSPKHKELVVCVSGTMMRTKPNDRRRRVYTSTTIRGRFCPEDDKTHRWTIKA